MSQFHAEIPSTTAVVNDLESTRDSSADRERTELYRFCLSHPSDLVDDGCEDIHFVFFLQRHERSIGEFVSLAFGLIFLAVENLFFESFARVSDLVESSSPLTKLSDERLERIARLRRSSFVEIVEIHRSLRADPFGNIGVPMITSEIINVMTVEQRKIRMKEIAQTEKNVLCLRHRSRIQETHRTCLAFLSVSIEFSAFQWKIWGCCPI